MYVLFLGCLSILFYLKYRPETPPNTPQRACAAAHQNEHDQRNLDSPEQCWIPHNANPPPYIPPFNLPIPQPPLFAENMALLDNPFGPPPPPVQQYQHLPQDLAEQLQNLPALALAPGHGRGRGRGRGRGQVQDNANLVPVIPVSVELTYIYISLY
jgi:hypothetical protein